MALKDYFSKPIATDLTWEDLDIPKVKLSQIHQIEKWIKSNNARKVNSPRITKRKRGYSALFYGPGTGKTLTASLLGKYTNRNAYRIDLSMVISKYIGETEKNLAQVFNKADHKGWILFFDEADALFGKRTGVEDAHDKYANQEVSYLLQRIETYNGIVIIASESKTNIEETFLRLLDMVINFP